MAARSGAARWAALRTLGLALQAAMRPGAPTLPQRCAALPRMIRAAARGQYAGLSRGRLLALFGALAYVVSPVDLVPEGVLSVFGLADDAMVIGWLAAALIGHTEDYLAWEREGSGPATQAGPQDAPAPGTARPGAAFGAGPWSDTVPSYVVK